MAHSFAAASVVDSETSSERDAIIGDARAPANTSRRLILGLGALSGVLALCSVAALVGYQSLDASEGPAVVSASEAPENLKHRVGCTNWDEIVLKKIENSNDTACHDACHLTPGCHAYNVQESDSAACTDTEHGLKKGTCYIFGEGCRETKNDCWDLYYEKPPIAGWKLETARMGCSNWREAAMSVVKSADQCGAACTANSSCKFFNYQPAACDGPEQNQEGACYLFTSCTELANKCWDLYKYTAEEVITTNTTFVTTQSVRGAAVQAALKSWVAYLQVPDKNVKVAYLSQRALTGKTEYKVQILYKKSGWTSRRLQDTEQSVTEKINKAAEGDSAAVAALMKGINDNGGATATELSTTKAESEVVDSEAPKPGATTAAPQTTKPGATTTAAPQTTSATR
jgi:hypothetical protein